MSGRGYKLSAGLQAEVVTRLAAYESPYAIARSLKREHGIDIRRQSVERYDPSRYAGRGLAEKWATLFRQTRERLYGEGVINYVNRTKRFVALDRVARDKIRLRQVREARLLLLRMAKELSEGVDERRGRTPFESMAGETRSIADLDRSRALMALINQEMAAR